MEMNQIRYFLAVAELLNFTRAAEACNVSQPSLTRAVKLLEREFGGDLFLRARSNTRLTELGRIVLPYLASVSEKALGARKSAQEFTKPNKQALRLGVMCTIAPAQLVELLGAVHVRHPGVEIELVDATAAAMNERLLDGDIEVAVFCLPGEEPDARIRN